MLHRPTSLFVRYVIDLAGLRLGQVQLQESPVAVHFVSTTGSDANSGLNWANAKLTPATTIQNANPGDSVLIAAGTYVIGSPFYILAPAGVNVYGAGIDQTILQSSLNGFTNPSYSIYCITGGGLLSDLTIQGTAPTHYQYPLGDGIAQSPSSYLVQRVKVIGGTDCVTLSGPLGSESMTCNNCIFLSTWDCVEISSGGASVGITLNGCCLVPTGPSTETDDANGILARGISTQSSNLTVVANNCLITVSGGSSHNYGIQNTGGSPTTVTTNNSTVTATGTDNQVSVGSYITVNSVTNAALIPSQASLVALSQALAPSLQSQIASGLAGWGLQGLLFS